MSPQIRCCHPLSGVHIPTRTGRHWASVDSITLRNTFLTIPGDRCEACVCAHVWECVVWVCVFRFAVSACPCIYVSAYAHVMHVCTRMPICVHLCVWGFSPSCNFSSHNSKCRRGIFVYFLETSEEWLTGNVELSSRFLDPAPKDSSESSKGCSWAQCVRQGWT